MNDPKPAATSNAPPLLRRDDKKIAWLTLNRPAQRNALSRDLMHALQTELDNIANDPAIAVVIIGATGPTFCSGHDLKEIRALSDEAKYRDLFLQCSRLMQTIVRLPKPVIACVQGTATAAGCQLVASCDLAIAIEEAEFATPGVNIGLFCSTPMVALSRNIGRKQAMEMLLTGESIDSATALRFGLINRAVPASKLDTEVDGLAQKIVSKSPLVLKIGKEAFYAQLEKPLGEAYDYASEVMTKNMLARDAKEGISAFIEKRPPHWTNS